jgi:tetratricopeptide (TPR) repeat protein
MKRFAILMIVVFVGVSLHAQKSAVQSAYNYQRNGKLDKAQEYIDKAVANEKTIGYAKAWYYRGNIYIDIYSSPLDAFRGLADDPLGIAYTSYKKAIELDDKSQYTDEIMEKMPGLGELFFNDGAKLYNDGIEAQNAMDSAGAVKSFNKSVTAFETAYNIYTDAGINDTTTMYYISIAAELAGDYEKAKIKLNKLIDLQYPNPGIYSSLADIYYTQDNDVQKAMETYALGRERFPNDLNLLLLETNLFLGEEMTEQALANLQKAAEIDTTNPTIFFAIGAKYNELVDDTTNSAEVREDSFQKAVVAYNKAIDLKPDYFDPYYNLGALYVNRAVTKSQEAGGLPLDAEEEYNALMEDAKNSLETCLPYLEKAHELLPEDISTIVSLKEIYTRLNMMDKMKEMDAKLEALE